MHTGDDALKYFLKWSPRYDLNFFARQKNSPLGRWKERSEECEQRASEVA